MFKTREHDLRYGFVEIFFVTSGERPRREGQITISKVSTQKFTREQRIMLNKLKEHAEDVEFEEIQG